MVDYSETQLYDNSYGNLIDWLERYTSISSSLKTIGLNLLSLSTSYFEGTYFRVFYSALIYYT